MIPTQVRRKECSENMGRASYPVWLTVVGRELFIPQSKMRYSTVPKQHLGVQQYASSSSERL